MKIVVFNRIELLAEGIANIVKQNNPHFKVLTFWDVNHLLDYKFKNKVDVIITEVILSNDENVFFFQNFSNCILTKNVIITTHSDSSSVLETFIPFTQMYLFLNQSKLEIGNQLTEYFSQVALENNNTKKATFENNDYYESQQQIPILTPIEKKIINLMLEGNTSKMIGEQHQNSANTINNQKNKLIKKFKCSNSTELVVKLIRLGYVKL